MSDAEFPLQGAGVNARIEESRARTLEYRNSRVLCWITMFGSIVGAFMALCMAIMVISVLTSPDASGFDKVARSVKWGGSALLMVYGCMWLWSMGRVMLHYRVRFESLGVTFRLGTRKKPEELFLAWEQIATIRQKRIGNAQQFWVLAKNGSEVRFSSYTFFRPTKVARMVAERTGLTIEKV
jgi:hypothetical protein